MHRTGSLNSLENGNQVSGRCAYGIKGVGNFSNGNTFIHIKEDKLPLIFHDSHIGLGGDDGLAPGTRRDIVALRQDTTIELR